MPKQREVFKGIESKFKIDDAVYARNFGKGPEWVEARVTKVLGMRNYLVSVNVNGHLIWKRHLSQLFERKLYNSVELSNPSPPKDKLPVVPHMPIGSPPSVVNDSNVINMPKDSENHENCTPNSVPTEVKDTTNSQSRPSVGLRRST